MLRIYNGILYACGSHGMYRYNPNFVPPVMAKIIYPLNKNNVWLYKKDTYWFFQNSSSDAYSLDTIFVEKDTLINGQNYYSLSIAQQDWLRYSENENKVFLYHDNQESVFLDFTLSVQYPFSKLILNTHMPWDAWVDSAGQQNFLGLEENYFNLLGPNGARGSRKEKYHSNLGLVNQDFGSYSMGSGSSGENSTLIQAIINDGKITKEFSMPYYPEISITPPDTITTAELSFNFKVGHKLSSFISYGKSLNFIDSVFLLGYYKKGNSVTKPVKFAASNLQGTMSYSVHDSLDLVLLQNGYSFCFKVVAKDKGIIKRFSTAPDTGYFYVKYCPGPLNIKKQKVELMDFILEQNYPNPFNPVTIINYSLPKKSGVSLVIYDILGREVKTLVSEEKGAGYYSVEWRGENNLGQKTASGMYIYKLKAGNFTSVKKMLILK